MHKMTLPTPLYNSKDFPDVYEPSEDTHLFLDALEKDINDIVKRKPLLVCEIGSGSGVLITALATILKKSSVFFSTDVNTSACLATQNTATLNSVFVQPVSMNLMTMFRCKFDMILFNPPYVVTDDTEITGNGLNRAFAGGTKGRLIIDEFLKQLPCVLSESGVCYLLLLRENKLNDIKNIVCKIKFNIEIILERKIPGEYLYICKLFRVVE